MKHLNYKVQATINAHPEAVWELISSGEDVDKWLAPITSCKVEGNKRYCSTADGSFEENILEVNHENWTFTYSIPTQHMLPVVDIVGSMEVTAIRPDITLIAWSWNYLVDEENEKQVKQGLEMLGDMGIKGIETFVNNLVH